MAFTTISEFNVGDLTSGAALTLAAKFWSIMNGGAAIGDTVTGHLSESTLAHPVYVADGDDSHFRFEFSDTPVEVAGAYSTQAAMNADLVPGAGTAVNCWDPDPAKRGRYTKVGGTGTGSWTLASATPADKAWSDYNHPQRLLELLICSWVHTADPLPFMGPQMGWTGPADSDWRGVRMTLSLGCEMLELGPWSKIGMHVQGSVADRSAALAALYGEGDKYFIPNFINTRTLISDALGFGQDSWGRPNDVPVVQASGRKDIVIDFSTDDLDWECLGDPGRDPTGRLITYGSAPVAEVLADLQGNSYLLAHHDAPRDGASWWSKSSAEAVKDFDRVRGALLFYGCKIEAPA
jgi:hypothetical protein